MKRWFVFPNPVNESASRVVAGGALAMSLLVALGHQWWVLPILAFGFVARVLSGPRFSPLGFFATKVVVPGLRLPTKLVAGPPKRFAQGIGATFSVAALASYLAGSQTAAVVLTALVAAAALLEAAIGFCVGCKLFGGLIQLGVIPASACEACNDLPSRLAPV